MASQPRLTLPQDGAPVSNGILKFINEHNSKARPIGKKCNPHRQFGVSSDAPAEFCTKNTLIADMSSRRQKNHCSSKPEFYSQKNFFTIELGREKSNFIQQYNESFENNKSAFRRTSSKATQFYDKNAWMGDRFFVMGHERSQKALEISRFNIQIKCQSAKSMSLSRKRSSSASGLTRNMKQLPTHDNMKEKLLYEKNRIREMRNMLALKTNDFQEIQRPKTSSSIVRFQKSDIKERSGSKNNRRQFQINLPDWQVKDFNVKFMEWNPERNLNSPESVMQMSTKKSVLQTNSKFSSSTSALKY